MPTKIMRTTTFAALILVAIPVAFGQAPPPAPVVVVPVVDRQLRTGQTFVGTIQPEQRATIGSAVDGRVVKFPVNEGDRVEAGQALAELLTETIKLELEGAEGELQFREQELAELENGTRQEDIDQAKAQTLAARTAVTLAEKRLVRIDQLIKTNTASRDQLDEAQAAVDNAKAVLAEREAAEALAIAGPRKERIAQSKARVAIQKAMVNKLSDQIKKHTMIARFAGYVVAEHTEIGQWVNRGDAVAEIVGIDRVDVTASVLEAHVPYIEVGMEARVEVPALPDRVFIGKVAIVVPQGDARSRTFPVKVRLDNEFKGDKPLLNAGMLARVTLPTGPEKMARMVPKDALVLGGATPIVFVVDTGEKGVQTVRPMPVTLGAPSGALIEVRGDLQPKELVVVQGNERLRPGQTVKIIREAAVEKFAAKDLDAIKPGAAE
ncbi:efflux RND transporter periplasmic adaptor subunit [Fuerstiella marisgermanici]|uniref:Multidrug transporter MdtA n=1 Tax=Fuerstiella marisgermanici TaxID=1891926 RepID=A0A1P8W9D3_9PLAN|nr:efflux RND transporter periplasmic adaptor subunit [Fuerstiella marisgermanici]APZ90660.1 Multidrug transporter MdtA [Fuerstiella marisgermanici]